MSKDELEKEAEKWLRKYLLCCNCEKKCNCIDSNSYCEEQVLKSYVAGAEPREKRIAELEAKIGKMKCCENCGKEFTKECAWWKRAEENRQINTCKDWEIKEK